MMNRFPEILPGKLSSISTHYDQIILFCFLPIKSRVETILGGMTTHTSPKP